MSRVSFSTLSHLPCWDTAHKRGQVGKRQFHFPTSDSIWRLASRAVELRCLRFPQHFVDRTFEVLVSRRNMSSSTSMWAAHNTSRHTACATCRALLQMCVHMCSLWGNAILQWWVIFCSVTCYSCFSQLPVFVSCATIKLKHDLATAARRDQFDNILTQRVGSHDK